VAGDAEQLERFRPYLRFLLRLSWDTRLQTKCDPSDLIQQTLLQAHQGLSQYNGSSDRDLAAWLRQILANVIRERQRHFSRDKRNLEREQSLEDLLDQSSRRLSGFPVKDPTPSRQFEMGERALLLAAAMEMLTEEQEQVVVLHYWHGHSIAEVADSMGRTPDAVGGLLYRGVKKLRSLLRDKF